MRLHAIFAVPFAMDPRDISIADHTYLLPEERIAQVPLAERDASLLLQYRAGTITDHVFRDLPDLLPEGSLLVLNNTRVVNARIVLNRSSGARIEVLCLEPADQLPVEVAFARTGTAVWNAFVGNAKRWRANEELLLQQVDTDPRHDDRTAARTTILRARRAGPDQVAFTWEPAGLTFAEVLDRVGHVPLPPYMKRPDVDADRERYNTVFARNEGSVAAPTASLHFTPEVLEHLQVRGISRAELTLHVGAGTFLPVKSDRLAGHLMHGEQVRIPLQALEVMRSTLGEHPVVAVGTTALRTLESIYWHGVALLNGRSSPELVVGQWDPYEQRTGTLPSPQEALDAVIGQVRARPDRLLSGRTELLIAPGYQVRMADALITNFHQPQSTLLLLVEAFVGEDRQRIYQHALDGNYRFLSYGDPSLLWRKDR